MWLTTLEFFCDKRSTLLEQNGSTEFSNPIIPGATLLHVAGATSLETLQVPLPPPTNQHSKCSANEPTTNTVKGFTGVPKSKKTRIL